MGGILVFQRPDKGAENSDATAPPSALPTGYFASCGFGSPERLTAGPFEIAYFPKLCGGQTTLYRADDSTFCLHSGTMVYRGTRGREASRLFLSDRLEDSIVWDELFGSFCVIVLARGALTLQVDRMGTYHVWRDPDRKVFASAFLAVADTLKRRTINPQGVYEYVFQGATYGGASVLREVTQADCARIHVLSGDAVELPQPHGMVRPPAKKSIDAHLERTVAGLQKYYASMAKAGWPCIDTALSGGYDSRLTLGLLQQAQIPLRLHVYGGRADADVRIATHISAAEKLPLQHVDKSDWPIPEPDAFPKIVQQNYALFDAFPPDGIFDNGSDRETRMDRGKSDTLMLNGGGGEIYRNFFYLPNRSYVMRNLLWSFYSRFDPAATTEAFDAGAYHRNLGVKIKRVLGREIDGSDRLSRRDIEYLYPHFRCRFWMGRNNGINNRIGASLTPFIDANIVPDALNLPLRFKNHGRFEGRMIRRVSPALAAYSSVYGHDFAHDPPLGRVLKDWATLLRPTSGRRFTFRLRRRTPDPRPVYLTSPYLEQVIDTGFPYMRYYLRPDRLFDNEQYNRMCSLEYLFEQLSPDMAEKIDPAD